MNEDDAQEIMIEFVERLRAGDEAGADVIAQAAIDAGCSPVVFEITKRGLLAARAGNTVAVVAALDEINRLAERDECDDATDARVAGSWSATRGVA